MNSISGADKAFLGMILLIASSWTTCSVVEDMTKRDAYVACIARNTPEACKWVTP